MPSEQPHRRANQLLAQLVPSGVLREARKLAERFQQEEIFRVYLLKRMWFIFPAVVLFFLVSTVCAYAVFLFLLPLSNSQPEWFGIAVSLLVPIVWFGGLVLQLYLLFSWLERRASKQ